MPQSRRLSALLSACAFAFALAAHAQDSPPSLGDVARQTRLQKQQQEATFAKDGQPKDGQSKVGATKSAQTNGQPAVAKDAQPAKTTKRVITNDEIPEHIGPTRTSMSPYQSPMVYPQPSYGEGKTPADYLKDQILLQKQNIANLQNEIESVNASIQYAGGNCVSGCVQWNERQKQKQDQVESMKVQLEQMRKRLEDVQELARKQGFGSSVYDP
ncbi:MAG TPA: hypothetical protein VJ999_05945 [Candidatus Sulfotelmatobacter sp.]|nr:hypothetical protein [Candidatus Sulfotelmatobacter sp.]